MKVAVGMHFRKFLVNPMAVAVVAAGGAVGASRNRPARSAAKDTGWG
ncbi:hypothetical protein GCM10010521_44480 [Streptomyces rameus]|uniref:Uncharacterized protein n=1 Tax=Streptomyces rameus TaxID=68261 RepID=A0ABP6NL69_9ACTN